MRLTVATVRGTSPMRPSRRTGKTVPVTRFAGVRRRHVGQFLLMLVFAPIFAHPTVRAQETKPLLTLSGLQGEAYSVTFSPDGKVVVAASNPVKFAAARMFHTVE